MKFLIGNLPNDTNELKQIIVDFQRKNLHWQEKYQTLLEVLNLIRRKRFKRSTELLSLQDKSLTRPKLRRLAMTKLVNQSHLTTMIVLRTIPRRALPTCRTSKSLFAYLPRNGSVTTATNRCTL